MLDKTEMIGPIKHAVNRLRQEREGIDNSYYTLGEEDGFHWCLYATYYQILNVISWDLISIVKDEFFELLAEQDPIQFEGGAEHVDFDEDPYSDYLLNEFGDTYIEGFVTTVKHFWKKNKSKIR